MAAVSATLRVVRVSAYPHRVEETTQLERAEIERRGSNYQVIKGWDDPSSQEALRDADVVLCTYEPIDEARLDKLPGCRMIVMGSVGLDGVDLDGARARGITVCNMPDICVDEVAEHTLALLLASARKLTVLDREMRSGVWQRDSLEPMARLNGSRLGLIGAGRIGQAVATRAAAFGMHTTAYDPFLDPQTIDAPIQLSTLDVVTSTSDFLSLHVPATPDTRHLISEAELHSMKTTAILINTARGALVDQPALVRALQLGWIRGAALDVFETEPLEQNSPLLSMDNVILTPHSGGFSDEVVDTIPRLAVHAVLKLAAGEKPPDQLLVGDLSSRTNGAA